MSNLPVGAENDPNAPWNEEKEYECAMCGEPMSKNTTYCSNACYFADNPD